MTTSRAVTPDEFKTQEFEEKTSTNSSTSNIINHMKLFVDKKGWISEKSVTAACIEKLHLPADKAKALGRNTMIVATGLNIKGTKKSWLCCRRNANRFKVEDAAGMKLFHPHDTGLFQLDGNFNEPLFNRLLLDRPAEAGALPPDRIIVDRDPDNASVRVIFASDLKQYLKVNCQDKNNSRWLEIAKNWNCLKRLIMNAIGKAGNQGEFELLLESDVITMQRIHPVTGQSENCIAVEKLRAFYKNSKQFIADELAQQEHAQQSSPTDLRQRL